MVQDCSEVAKNIRYGGYYKSTIHDSNISSSWTVRNLR